MIFRDRFDAAEILARRLEHYRNDPKALIVAIPRGGLQIGYGLAKALVLPLDIILTKKIGHPENPEFAIGAVSLSRAVLNPEILENEAVPKEYIQSEIQRIRRTLQERQKRYELGRPLSLQNKIVILTDDGVATGKTLLAAIELVRAENPQRIIVAVPVGSPDTIRLIRSKADEVVCLQMPENFFGVGQFYENFYQVDDEEAIELLKRAHNELHMAAGERWVSIH